MLSRNKRLLHQLLLDIALFSELANDVAFSPISLALECKLGTLVRKLTLGLFYGERYSPMIPVHLFRGQLPPPTREVRLVSC